MTQDELKAAIREEFLDCIRRTIEKHRDKHQKGKLLENPFQRNLFSKEAIFFARFERSFSTSFGQGTIERLSRLIAIYYGASEAETQRLTEYQIDRGITEAIATHLKMCKEGKLGRPTQWEKDLGQILSAREYGQTETGTINSDLYFRRKNTDYFVSIKTVQPNKDQSLVAKQDCLLLKANDRSCRPFFGLYYNPYGTKRKDYRHSPAFSAFDMVNDEVVLIGKDYWETIGGRGAMKVVIDVAKSLHQETEAMIHEASREFLG